MKFKEAARFLRSVRFSIPSEVLNQLNAFESVPNREVLHREVDELIECLTENIDFTEENICERLQKNDDEFFKTAFYYMWCDYNWFKHRPMGYPVEKHARTDHRIQFALAVRAYCALCDFYSWCYSIL
jgi:hypothetical protein